MLNESDQPLAQISAPTNACFCKVRFFSVWYLKKIQAQHLQQFNLLFLFYFFYIILFRLFKEKLLNSVRRTETQMAAEDSVTKKKKRSNTVDDAIVFCCWLCDRNQIQFSFCQNSGAVNRKCLFYQCEKSEWSPIDTLLHIFKADADCCIHGKLFML